ncbi:PadR family transcriptional regulator [Chloroflexota bacterium]
MDREFFLGLIKIHILYHASKDSIFGAEMTQEIVRHGYNISPGTLYPTLHSLEKEGYLKSSSKVVEGKVIKKSSGCCRRKASTGAVQEKD